LSEKFDFANDSGTCGLSYTSFCGQSYADIFVKNGQSFFLPQFHSIFSVAIFNEWHQREKD